MCSDSPSGARARFGWSSFPVAHRRDGPRINSPPKNPAAMHAVGRLAPQMLHTADQPWLDPLRRRPLHSLRCRACVLLDTLPEAFASPRLESEEGHGCQIETSPRRYGSATLAPLMPRLRPTVEACRSALSLSCQVHPLDSGPRSRMLSRNNRPASWFHPRG